MSSSAYSSAPSFGLRLGLMLAGNFLIGFSIGLLRLAEFGVDAFTCMNLGISGFLGISFGSWQLLLNAVLLAVIFFARRNSIGLGTLVNMAGVGYLADFVCWLAQDLAGWQPGLPARVALLAFALPCVGLGVALYMGADMGVAPYDAVGMVISSASGGRVNYGRARVCSDVTVILIGVAFCLLAGNRLGLILGIGTVCNACFNGPLIQFFSERLVSRLLPQRA